MLTLMRFAAATIAALLAAAPANAQLPCGERNDVLRQLAGEHDEKPVAIGLASNGGVVEVLASTHGNWTIIVTGPTGLACLVAVGEAWEFAPRLALGGPEA